MTKCPIKFPTLRPKRGLAILALLAMSVATPAGLAAPAHASDLIEGRDSSNHQPRYDWTGGDVGFGIVKATEGRTFVDHTFPAQWAALADADVVRGAYHFGHPRNDPIAEADFFLSVVDRQPVKKGDLLVLDLETSDGMSDAHVNAWAKQWLERVKERTGTTPLFYANWNFAARYGQGLGDYPLWVAYYNQPKGGIPAPPPWKKWIIHQYAEYPVDQNVTTLSLDELRALGRPGK